MAYTGKVPPISIHVPREGDDNGSLILLNPGGDFNPRPPRGGRPRRIANASAKTNFNPRPPRGGRLGIIIAAKQGIKFQSTSPARGTTTWHAPQGGGSEFQSTSPARGTTLAAVRILRATRISIHVPREGDDYSGTQPTPLGNHFNPRPPRGGRPANLDSSRLLAHYFNPRPPRGGRLGGRQNT